MTSWPDRDAAFDDAAGALREMLRAPASKGLEARPFGSPGPGVAGSPAWGAALLGITAKPTDLDRDRFVRAGFTATAALFEQRLTELATSDPRIETDFERIDSRSFAASVYVEGKRAGQVSIWHGSDVWQNALCLSYDTATSTRNSMNDWLPVEYTPGGLAFTAGKSLSRVQAKGLMDPEGAASYLWQSFLEQVRSRIR